MLLAHAENTAFESTRAAALDVLAILLRETAALARICALPPATKEGQAPAPVSRLVALLRALDPAVQASAALCIASAACTDVSRRLLLQAQPEGILSPMTWSENPKLPLNPTVAVAACRAVAALAAGQVRRQPSLCAARLLFQTTRGRRPPITP